MDKLVKDITRLSMDSANKAKVMERGRIKDIVRSEYADAYDNDLTITQLRDNILKKIGE